MPLTSRLKTLLVRKRLWIGLSAVFAMLGLVFAAFWIAAAQLVAPFPATIGDPPREFAGARSVRIAAGDHDTRGWFLPARTTSTLHGAVLLLHGIHADRRSMVGRARFLTRAGYCCLLIDLQGSGETPGEKSTLGVLEARDAHAALGWLRRNVPPGTPVEVIGNSLGGAASLLGESPLPADAMILEAVFTDVHTAIWNRMDESTPRFAAPITWLLESQIAPRLHIAPESISPLRAIPHVKCPVLIIAGDADRHTRLPDTQALYAAAPEPKSLWLIPGARHVDLHLFARTDYETRILAFLAGVKPPGPGSAIAAGR